MFAVFGSLRRRPDCSSWEASPCLWCRQQRTPICLNERHLRPVQHLLRSKIRWRCFCGSATIQPFIPSVVSSSPWVAHSVSRSNDSLGTWLAMHSALPSDVRVLAVWPLLPFRILATSAIYRRLSQEAATRLDQDLPQTLNNGLRPAWRPSCLFQQPPPCQREPNMLFQLPSLRCVCGGLLAGATTPPQAALPATSVALCATMLTVPSCITSLFAPLTAMLEPPGPIPSAPCLMLQRWHGTVADRPDPPFASLGTSAVTSNSFPGCLWPKISVSGNTRSRSHLHTPLVCSFSCSSPYSMTRTSLV